MDSCKSNIIPITIDYIKSYEKFVKVAVYLILLLENNQKPEIKVKS